MFVSSGQRQRVVGIRITDTCWGMQIELSKQLFPK